MTTPATRILLADDHALVRRGLRLILDAEPDLTVVAEAADGDDAVELAMSTDIDLAVLDIAMPRMAGIRAGQEIAWKAPHVQMVMLSMYDNEQYLFESLKVGASGYVLKSAADKDLLEACRAAMRGEPFLYPGAVTMLIREHVRRDSQGREDARSRKSQAEVLTNRERAVLELIAEGYSAKDIAGTLVISARTVDRHRANILQKLGMRDRLDLTRYAIRNGLVEP